ncbi:MULTISPECIES: hypothetical protein [Cysteiniphilum]|uniref:Uncharacterized protein n=1 Tax=Cysteiniphilum litorale TaxID=2056700 RepID=A0A8J2Z6M2_9GAMM|nr:MULTISPECIES: hypothetical protein [Cysteiniphilum]GGG06783.1 hypothetical protein GCM10010995_25400 [Cysteiniphilum litorale]
MTENERQNAILQHLAITRWYAKDNPAHKEELSVDETHIIANKLSVIISTLEQQDRVKALINAMFTQFSVCFIEKDQAQAEKNIASSAIILYDENLTLKTLLDQSLHDRCYALKLNELNRAEVKKQTMMNLYAVSDFAIR